MSDAPGLYRIARGLAGWTLALAAAGCGPALAEEFFFSFEDLDFCLRARRAGFATVCAEEAVAYHEGSRSIGARSSRRLYFAARNHLLLAERATPTLPPALGLVRGGSILALNLAHALRSADRRVVADLAAVLRGTWQHLRRRYGADGSTTPRG